MNTITENGIIRIKIDNSDVFLEELGDGKGKITISDTYNHNYSYFWGAMGGTLVDFIKGINAGYFADKLLGQKTWQMDTKKTFSALRKFISTELDLPYYTHMEFQKGLREVLREFQRDCEEVNSQRYFVDNFYSCFVNRLDYSLIEYRTDMETVQRDFKGLSEVWHFIQEKPSEECLWLQRFHHKLKKQL